MNRGWSRRLIAFAVAVAILPVSTRHIFAAPPARGAELSLLGEVAVNGQKAISGLTIYSESTIVTAQASSASVSLGRLGRIELLPNTNLRLSFADKSINGFLMAGRARFSIPAGVAVNMVTRDGSVIADERQPTSFSVNTENGNTIVVTESGAVELRTGTTASKIAPGEKRFAGTPQTPKKDDDDDKHHGVLWAVLLATGGAIAAVVWVVTHDKDSQQNDMNFGGTVIVPSP